MTSAFRSLLLAALCIGLACTEPIASADLPNPGDFRTGMTRGEVLESFGPPLRKQAHAQADGPMLGPIEDFLPRVPAGGRVEVWAYSSVGGTMELYFVNESEDVAGLGFAPEGVVFEAGP